MSSDERENRSGSVLGVGGEEKGDHCDLSELEGEFWPLEVPSLVFCILFIPSSLDRILH